MQCHGAALFILMLAVGCKQQKDEQPLAPMPTVSAPKKPRPTNNTLSREGSDCFLGPPDPCDPGEHCKSAGRWRADCPDDPGAVKRRPKGKESFIRIRPWLLFDSAKQDCSYQPEWFCSPPDQKGECTRTPPSIRMACTRDDATGTLSFGAFVYKDGTDKCRKVPASSCKMLPGGGRCDLPDGDVVPCPEAG
jgi:hypothetical protein